MRSLCPSIRAGKEGGKAKPLKVGQVIKGSAARDGPLAEKFIFGVLVCFQGPNEHCIESDLNCFD